MGDSNLVVSNNNNNTGIPNVRSTSPSVPASGLKKIGTSTGGENKDKYSSGGKVAPQWWEATHIDYTNDAPWAQNLKEGLGNFLSLPSALLSGAAATFWEIPCGAFGEFPDYDSAILNARHNPEASKNLTIACFSADSGFRADLKVARDKFLTRRQQTSASNAFLSPGGNAEFLLHKLKEYIRDVNQGQPLDSLTLDTHGNDNVIVLSSEEGYHADNFIDYLLLSKNVIKEGGTLKLTGCLIVSSPETRAKFQALANRHKVTIVASNVEQRGHEEGAQFYFKPEK